MKGFYKRLALAMCKNAIKIILTFTACLVLLFVISGMAWLLSNDYIKTFWSILLVCICLVFSIFEAANPTE